MKLYKLLVHQKHFNDHELVLNPKEFPDIKIGDIVEIYHPDAQFSRLLLQVNSLIEEFQQKGTISVEQSVATRFQLRTYTDVCFNRVDPKAVALDLVELTFKDQYFSRSDMYGLIRSMVNTCVYLGKKIQHLDMRTQANELWAKGEKVVCGVVNDNTRMTFRSHTAVQNIFIQMSSEMWEFDPYGDLYFEKAVSGFLNDLFAKWKSANCCHDVTIVMFSRTFYDAQSIEEFPEAMWECLQMDYRGRYYEDFYRVVVQNERYDDWTSTLIQLKKLFIEYPQRVLHYHDALGNVPKTWNSTAAQGNFLETLNLGLNSFEKYYLDRNFDRTGKVSVVITPGAGVFEVDRELANVTKQRSIDCGNGSDLVCMGEQPLHGVPLFKFHTKHTHSSLDVGDDYNIPHWINQSFYTSRSQAQRDSHNKFQPRIKIAPPKPPSDLNKDKPKEYIRSNLHVTRSLYNNEDENFPFVDYDEYDAQVFKTASVNRASMKSGARRPIHPHRDLAMSPRVPATFSEALQQRRVRPRHLTDDFTGLYIGKEAEKEEASPSKAIGIPGRQRLLSAEFISNSLGHMPNNGAGKGPGSTHSADSLDSEDQLPERPQSAGSPVGHQSRFSLHNYRPHRALINPFFPSRMSFKVTSNRRRWVHAFPTDPHGALVQPHHQQKPDTIQEEETPVPTVANTPTREVIQAAKLAVEARKKTFRHDSLAEIMEHDGRSKSPTALSSSSSSVSGAQLTETSSTENLASLNRLVPSSSMHSMSTAYSVASANTEQSAARSSLTRQASVPRDLGSKALVWGVTGEQQWSIELTTGVDWKSLAIPAALPITTDFFPDSHSLQHDYVYSDYSLLPEEFNNDMWQRSPGSLERKPLTTVQVFREMVNMRLALGFQLIVQNKSASSFSSHSVSKLSSSPMTQSGSKLMRSRLKPGTVEEFYLSIGRIFHKLSLNGSTITVTRYWPRHPFPTKDILYRYRFQVPDVDTYDISWTKFCSEKLENYNWNYLDQYLCTRGEGEFELKESLKFWRCRFQLLPACNEATRKIIAGAKRCDIYEEKPVAEQQQLIEGFLRFLEIMNKIRRPSQSRKSMIQSGSASSVTSNQPETALQEKQGDAGKTGTSSVVDHLNINSPLEDILEAMKNPSEGIAFLNTKQAGLPPLPNYTFVSGEAIAWLRCSIDGINCNMDGMRLLQKMIEKRMICHASGNFQHSFVQGFFLYYILSDMERQKGEPDPLGGRGFYTYSSFQFEWCEVAVHSNEDVIVNPTPEFLQEPMQPRQWTTYANFLNDKGESSFSPVHEHNHVNVDVDANRRSPRVEWATARYKGNYNPLCGYAVEVQWMVATGTILGDLINTYSRKAGPGGFHLLPVPQDPFALPYNPISDPLRGPIFVPLDLTCLNDGHKELFHEFEASSHQERLFLMQDLILTRFGFVKYSCAFNQPSPFSAMRQHQNLYIHCSGGMFALIPDNHSRSPRSKTPSQSVMLHHSSSSHKDYIISRNRNRTISFNNRDITVESKVGFLWSWNFLLTKRWRSQNTGDESFQDKMLEDFRQFCSNREDRLVEFWTLCHEQAARVREADSTHEPPESPGSPGGLTMEVPGSP